jgi:23S rRNA pseudouridine2605 synthase
MKNKSGKAPFSGKKSSKGNKRASGSGSGYGSKDNSRQKSTGRKSNFSPTRKSNKYSGKTPSDFPGDNTRPFKRKKSFSKNTSAERAEKKESFGHTEKKYSHNRFNSSSKKGSSSTGYKKEGPLKKSTASSYHLNIRKEKEDSPEEKIRLNKYIANSGVCSRRDADQLISLGEVSVNGKTVTELGFKVNKNDVVTLHGRRLKPEKHVYVLLNKPKDFITTTEDPQERKTVMSLVRNACKERIVPVGRLDRNTTGLLLFTNDGDLAEKLTHPSHKIRKIYQADLDKPITKEDFEKILKGLRLEDGPVKPDALAIVSPDKKSIGIEIHEGRNRIVRRIFEHLGYEVVKLDRVMYAGLTKKDLPRGHWRYLTEKEVIRLKHFS